MCCMTNSCRRVPFRRAPADDRVVLPSSLSPARADDEVPAAEAWPLFIDTRRGHFEKLGPPPAGPLLRGEGGTQTDDFVAH